jgi:transcription antitermination factor NusG
MNWFALVVKPQHEKAVAEQLRAKELEQYVPLYRARRRWSDRMKTVELPLFPRYVFCRFRFEQRLKALSIPSVLTIVGFAGKPAPVSETEIETVRAMVGSGLPVSPWPFLRAGQRVRITHGAMADVEGILVREKNSYRVVVNVELLNCGAAVEIDRELVVPAGPPPPRSSAAFAASGSRAWV